jgi:2-dehydro-3-deoxyphosphogluconate aldolase/(4S)-4-hydroxy-2-oxoglutarate aldolase
MLSTLQECRVLPVVTAHDPAVTVQLAQALQRGGMKAIEITLRTPAALDSIRAVSESVPGMMVAAGTVTNPAELQQVIDCGVSLALSPGATPVLLGAARESGLDFIPGVASASEVMLGLDHGFSVFKLFPAEALGGLGMLRSLGGPFPGARFCPTGGLKPDNFRDYLALPNVICCGGSWMAARNLVDNGNWNKIEALASEAMAD